MRTEAAKTKKKSITIHASFEEQRLHGQLHMIDKTAEERLLEMHRLNCKIFGEGYGKTCKSVSKIEIYRALPGESVNEFYSRING